MATPIANVIPLQGGSVCCGIAIAITIQCLYRYGFSLNINNDVQRQQFLNGLCLLGTISALLFYGLNQTKVSFVATNVTIFVTFLCGQWGQMVINHNSIIRFAATYPLFLKSNSKLVHRLCRTLYAIPFITLIPIYLAFFDTVNEQKALTTSYYNTVVSKYLFMAVVVVTESFATFTDIKLLQHVEYHTKQCGNHADSLDHKKDMFASYFTIWFFMLVDILLKILISLGFPVLFDGITTLLVITLRAQTNLKYGLMLKSILHSDPGHNSPPTTAQSIPHVPANSPETAFFMVSIEHNKSV